MTPVETDHAVHPPPTRCTGEVSGPGRPGRKVATKARTLRFAQAPAGARSPAHLPSSSLFDRRPERSRARENQVSVAALEPGSLTHRGAGQYVLRVDFVGPGGRRWSALGGGATLAEAIGFARDSSPSGVAWELVGWRDVYGD
jgi:hypothetical protein